MLSRLSGAAGTRALARCAAALVVATGMVAPAVARAAESKEITGDQTLGGDLTYDQLTITKDGKLHVPKLSATASGGWLRVKANKISIFAGGVIEADGAGHPGKASMNGAAPDNTMGGGKFNPVSGLPGGGGGFFGLGGNGTQEAVMGTCTSALGSEGGQAFFDVINPVPSLGAAGGSSSNMALSTAGTAGGGGIVLSAAVIQIDGMISANGLPSLATGGVAAGAGSGGTIQLVAALITGSGSLHVVGGDGAHGTGSTNPVSPFPANNGGGGSGGVIIVSLPGGAQLPATMTAAISGGATGDCTMGGGGTGAIVSLNPMSSCLDLDGDGVESANCGGMDCDDTNGAIKPGAKEACDGKDNDCNGEVDDGDDLCPPGSTCSNGKCVDSKMDAGAPDGGKPTSDAGSGATPDHIEFGGGCTLPASSGLAQGTAGGVMLALGTLALAASRRPLRRRGKRR